MDTQVREKLEGFAPPVPEAVWAAVESAVPGNDQPRGAVWWWRWPYNGLLLLLLGGAVALLSLNLFDNGQQGLPVDQQKNQSSSLASSVSGTPSQSSETTTRIAEPSESANNIPSNSDKGSLVDANSNSDNSVARNAGYNSESNSAQTSATAQVDVDITQPTTNRTDNGGTAPQTDQSQGMPVAPVPNDQLTASVGMVGTPAPSTPEGVPANPSEDGNSDGANLNVSGGETANTDVFPPVASPVLPDSPATVKSESAGTNDLEKSQPTTWSALDLNYPSSIASDWSPSGLAYRPLGFVDTFRLKTPDPQPIQQKLTWFGTVYGGPSMVYRRLHSPDNPVLVEHKNDHEKDLFAYNIGLNGGVMRGNWLLSTGAQLSVKGEHYNYNSDVISHNTVNKYFYLTVPVTVGYRFPLLDGVSFRPTASINSNFLLDAQASWLDPFTHSAVIKDDKANQNPYRNFGLSYGFGAEMTYLMGNRIQLILWPEYTRFMHSIYKSNESLQQHPYSIDINTGARFLF